MVNTTDAWVAAANGVGVVDGSPRSGRISQERKKTALIVCHGMGQQVPFETIDTTARLLKTAAESTTPITTRVVQLRDPATGQPLATSRAEIDLDGDGAAEVDVFECYCHSLGSVIAYDVLNALINDDLIDGRARSVIERTNALITFGSPLDKTAFLFRTQRPDHYYVREALAAAVQPLIVCYEYRPPWINLWSREDIVSGQLDFYDAMDARPCSPMPQDADLPHERKVRNCRDPYAVVPFLAHVQYWTSPLLASVLLEAIRHPELGPA